MHSEPSLPNWMPRLLRVVLLALLAMYLAQTASPLRINDDAVLLLRMTAAATDGKGVNPPEVSSHLPIGYPLLLSGFERAGVLRPATIVLINLAAAVAATLAGVWLLRRSVGLSQGAALQAVTLAGMSWVLVKHAALPVTDVVYMGWSLAALWAMSRACDSLAPCTGLARWRWLGLALLLLGAAILTRTNGLALVPALLWAFIGGAKGAGAAYNALRARRLALPVLVVVMIAAAVPAGVALSRSVYFEAFLRQHGAASVTEAAGQAAYWRGLEAGQVALNTSAATISSVSAPVLARLGADPAAAEPLSNGVLVVAGALLLLAAAAGMLMARRALTPLHVYLLAYAALLAAWPFQDPRFLLPVLALVFGVAIRGVQPLMRWLPLRVGAAAYVLVYGALCVFACVFTSRLSFAGDRFPSIYGSGRYANTYRAAFNQPINTASEFGVMPEALEVLKRYEPRARRAWQLDRP
ncbi:MAG: hypothetical protein ACT4PL_10710 [Phycisphaerales bacterium]